MEVTIFRDYIDSHKDGWYEEGRHDGMEIGIKIGIENESLKITKRMLESDYPLDEIERLTNLDKQKIIVLKGDK